MKIVGRETLRGHLEEGQIKQESACGTCDSWQVLDKGNLQGCPQQGSRVLRATKDLMAQR